jgi:hypothetical protein
MCLLASKKVLSDTAIWVVRKKHLSLVLVERAGVLHVEVHADFPCFQFLLQWQIFEFWDHMTQLCVTFEVFSILPHRQLPEIKKKICTGL